MQLANRGRAHALDRAAHRAHRAQLWATEHYKRGWARRAMQHYKKAMLDLEVPVTWENDAQLVERNQLRVSLHLNCAACALKLKPQRDYPHLSTPKTHYDVLRCG